MNFMHAFTFLVPFRFHGHVPLYAFSALLPLFDMLPLPLPLLLRLSLVLRLHNVLRLPLVVKLPLVQVLTSNFLPYPTN